VTPAKDPLRFFRIEAREISEELGRGALEIERGITPETVGRLMRLAHTLKGAASVVKQRGIANLTHALEDALVALEGRERPSRATIDAILANIDAIAAEVEALTPAQPSPAAVPEATADEYLSGLSADPGELQALMRGIAEATVQLHGFREATLLVEQARDLSRALAGGAQKASRAIAAPEARQRQLIEDLSRLLAELDQRLRTSADQTERELRHSRDAADRLHLIACHTAFGALERAVRDAAQALGKKAILNFRGGDVRLDAKILGLVHRALVQLVRNAIAHGIEAPTERVAVAKPEAGRIEIEITRRGNRIAFLCSDDGRGIDLEAIRRAAEARGIVPQIAEASGDARLLDLLLEGGLSTAEGVTEASGRGVGLGVVREVAAILKGDVSARTAKGEGSTIEILVPVSLAALEALLVEAKGSVAAIPITATRRTVWLAPGAVSLTADGASILDEGKIIPFIPLTEILDPAHPTEMSETEMTAAVVIESDSRRAAIGVHRLRGTADIVVRPTPPLAHASSIVAGIYLDPNGMPQPVIESEAAVAAALCSNPIRNASIRRRPAPILVIDDSLTTRMLEQSILESAGYDVELASSAEEALGKARKRRYSLFMVDVEMPGMDGLTFVETTRADPKLNMVPAILVTSRGSAEDRQRGADVGAYGYVVKSEFDQGKVLEIIRELVG